MNDDFLYDFRREPAPEFARRLRASLDEERVPTTRRPAAPRVARWASMAASVAIVGAAFTLPSVRAGAQAFLDLFRINGFVGVSFDAGRLAALGADGFDLQRLIGDQTEVLTSSGEPQAFGSPDDAAAAAGLGSVLEPAWMPVGWARDGIEVAGEGAVRLRVNTAALQGLAVQLGIDDVTVPAELDGRSVTVRVPPVVSTTYRNADREARMLQASAPEISVPAGMQLPVLAEIGLRILGLDRDEASRLAWSVDWRSTLLVPVPVSAASFSEVDVAGSPGLLIEPAQHPGTTVLMWASEDRVFALSGEMWAPQLLEMAQTTQ